MRIVMKRRPGWMESVLWVVMILVVANSQQPQATQFVTSGRVASSSHILNPAAYSSPSGLYQLAVVPSEANGSGSADYRLSFRGEEVWSGARPFSLWDAVVTDDGVVAGYAYERGVEPPRWCGMGVIGAYNSGRNGLAVFFLSKAGETLRREPITPQKSGAIELENPPYDSPAVRGMIADFDRDVLLFRMQLIPGSGNTDWVTYRLSTGDDLGIHLPEIPVLEGEEEGTVDVFRQVLRAERVPGTPFLLMHWYLRDRSAGPNGRYAVLSLLDFNGREVWNWMIPKEYSSFKQYWLVDQSREELWNQVTVDRRAFGFRSIHLKERFAFAIEPDSDKQSGWRVVETAREPDPGSQTSSKLETVELEFLGTIELQQPVDRERPIAEISDFAIDSWGNFGFLGAGAGKDIRFIRVSTNAEVLSDFVLNKAPLTEGGEIRIAPVSEDRWIVIQNGEGERTLARGWWLDAASGDLVELESAEFAFVDSVVPTQDGGFVTASSISKSSFKSTKLERFDRYGVSLWKLFTHEFDEWLSFEAIAWVPGVGVVALSDSGSDSLVYFSTQGEYLRTVELETILNETPNYPSGLRADLNGGLLLYDFRGSPSCFRIDAAGKGADRWTPRLTDGQTIPIEGGVQAAPDGSLWTSDGMAFLRLDERGVVDQTVRALSTNGIPVYERIWTVDSRGQIYTFNSLTASVHIYASDGSFVRALKTENSDYEIRVEIHRITVDHRGTVYIHVNEYGDSGREQLALAANGDRIGFVDEATHSFSGEWHSKPRTPGGWVLGSEEILLLDERMERMKTITKRANGDWLQYVNDGAVAEDGSLAVIASPLPLMSEKPAVVSIYDVAGEPVDAILLEEETRWARLAYNGTRLITGDDAGVFLYRLDGTPPLKFVPSDWNADDGWLIPYFSPDETELWLDVGTAGSLRRYRLN